MDWVTAVKSSTSQTSEHFYQVRVGTDFIIDDRVTIDIDGSGIIATGVRLTKAEVRDLIKVLVDTL